MKTLKSVEQYQKALAQAFANAAVVLTWIRPVKDGKFQFELAEMISTNLNTAALFNKGDDRFNQAKPRRAWQTVEASAFNELMGFDPSTLTKEDLIEIPTSNGEAMSVYAVAIANPQATVDGKKIALRVHIVETHIPNDYQAANLATTAKQTGREGNNEYLTKDGKLIFSNTYVDLNERPHVLIQHDGRVDSVANFIPDISIT